MLFRSAFLHLDSAEPRESSASNPLRVYAGERIDLNGMATNNFKVLASYEGEASITVPDPESSGFVLQASGDPESLLKVVAAAKGKFLVIESRNKPGDLEYVAVFDFSSADTAALIDCAKKNIH